MHPRESHAGLYLAMVYFLQMTIFLSLLQAWLIIHPHFLVCGNHQLCLPLRGDILYPLSAVKSIFTCFKRHGFVVLLHAAKCQAVSSARHVITHPMTKYNAKAMLSNINTSELDYIKFVIENLNIQDTHDKRI